ncbi:MAG TPA: hypothetical protein VEP68_10365 [Anaeromyxobacteraceae bacterium]|nr:hypothetical protein [Anaeromyxobacteraceae bacterium]
MAVRKRLGEMLLETGVIDQNQLDAALGHQRKWGGRLGQALVDLKITNEASIVEALSRKFGYEVIRLDGLEGGAVLEAALRLLPREMAARHNVLPYAADTSTVSVAMSDPGNIAVVDEIRFRAGRRVRVALAGDREIATAVRRFYFPGEKEPVSLELEDDAAAGETMMQFGSRSPDALDRFFATPPSSGTAPEPGPAALATGSAVPESVELEDFITPAPAPLQAVEAVARARAAAAPAAPAPAALSAPPVALAAAAPAPAAARAPAPARVPAGAPGHAPAPPPAAAAPAPAEELPEKSGTLELPLDAEIPPEAAGDDLWSQGPVRGPAPAAARPGSAEREVELLGAIDQLALGEAVAPETVKPSQLAAALVRLLIRKKVISFEEFLDEVGKK